MGSNSTFKINNDGSVTITKQLSTIEQNIIDILQIEKSKGGILANRRMKKRALEYANSVDYPEFKAGKLMLQYFPDEFGNYNNSLQKLIAYIMAIVFLLGGVICFICVIALLISDFDYYSSFSGPDFLWLVVGCIVGITVGYYSLKLYKTLGFKNYKSIK